MERTLCTVSWKRPLNLLSSPANFHEIVLLEDVDVVGDVVPHLGIKMAGAVASVSAR